jgi:hypothetical protein
LTTRKFTITIKR